MLGRRATGGYPGVEKRAAVNPISVQSAGKYLGNDGQWSVFVLRIGNPAQNIYALPSTLSTDSWVVGDFACPSGSNADADCATKRGGDPSLFTSGSSTSWNATRSVSFTTDASLLGGSGGDVFGGNYGYDTLGLAGQSTNIGSSPSAVLDRQIVATIQYKNIWLSLFGISPRAPNFSSNNTVGSYFTNLFTSQRIPSKSYSYTAGAYYRQTHTSLTFGGYDSSRFDFPGISLGIAQDSNRDLVVGLQNIQYSDKNGTNSALMDDGILALVDSTVAPLWLPQSACDKFASAFGLTVDSLTNLYMVNDASHDNNIKANATVVMTIGSNISGGSNTNITFPYAAFDLNYTNPSNSQGAKRYFPLRVASSANQYTLGRTFLQEAVLTVDYGRNNFSIAQAIPNTSSTKSNIVSITDSAAGAAASPSGPNGNGGGSDGSQSSGGSSSGGGANVGAIAGGVVGGVAALAIIALLVWWFRRRNRKNKDGAATGTAHKEDESASIDPNQSQPPTYSPDYFGSKTAGTAATPYQTHKNAASPAITPGINEPAGPSQPSAHQEMANRANANAVVNDPISWQHYNSSLSPSAATTPGVGPSSPGVRSAAAAGAAVGAAHYELAGSDANDRPREMASPEPQVRHELHSPGPTPVELFSPVTANHPSPATTHAPVSAVSTSTLGHALPAALAPAPAVSAAEVPAAVSRTQQPLHHSQRSSATLPHDMQPNVHEPMPANAGQKVTAAELASHRTSVRSQSGETTFQPSPDPDQHGDTGYFSGSEGQISRNTSVMSAEPRTIQQARPTLVQHHRSGSSGDMMRHVGTIAEEGTEKHDVTPP